MKISVTKELKEEIKRVKEEMSKYPVGSEEYLNAAKAENQLAETIGKLSPIDKTVLITTGGSCVMFIIYMIFSETRIMDTRGIQFVKSLFKK